MEIPSSTTQRLLEFSKARDWGQFHTPENLAKSISIEAAELLECFQWGESPDPAELRSELADVVSYCLLLANVADIDISQAIIEKIDINESRYPVEKSKGKSAKYDKL